MSGENSIYLYSSDSKCSIAYEKLGWYLRPKRKYQFLQQHGSTTVLCYSRNGPNKTADKDTTKVNNLNIYIFPSDDFPITFINVSYYLSLVVYQELKVYSNSTVIFTFSLKYRLPNGSTTLYLLFLSGTNNVIF